MHDDRSQWRALFEYDILESYYPKIKGDFWQF